MHTMCMWRIIEGFTVRFATIYSETSLISASEYPVPSPSTDGFYWNKSAIILLYTILLLHHLSMRSSLAIIYPKFHPEQHACVYK